MTEARTGAFNAAVDLAAGWLAACPTFATTWGAGSGDIILEERDAACPAGAHAFVALGDPGAFRRADAGTLLGSMPVVIEVLWPPYPTQGEAGGLSIADARSRANTQGWALFNEFASRIDVQVVSVEPAPPVRLEPSASPPGWWSMQIQIEFMAANA